MATEPDATTTHTWSKLTVAYLTCEGIGATVWWIVLWFVPASRAPFKAPGAPDSTLLAFAGADAVFFIGAALGAAYGLMRRRGWVWPVLCLHTGAAVYGALYCLGLSLLSGGGWLGTLLMAPSLVVLPFLTWRLRPGTFR